MLADDSDRGTLTLVLLTVDACPPLSILPAYLESTVNNLKSQAVLYTTPIATPQPMILSPEQVVPAATPASGNGPVNALTPTDNTIDMDPDSSLIDVTDETWAVILSHRIHNTTSLVERRPGLASGYLIKRAGRQDETSIMAMSVNMIHIDRPYTPQLREILAVYRGLGTLARLKGVADPVRSVIPWHVAAAVRAQELLSSVM
jgi:mediator of RNA polymerase II transcription subunit 13